MRSAGRLGPVDEPVGRRPVGPRRALEAVSPPVSLFAIEDCRRLAATPSHEQRDAPSGLEPDRSRRQPGRRDRCRAEPYGPALRLSNDPVDESLER